MSFRPPIGEQHFASTAYCDISLTTAVPEPERSAFGQAFAAAVDAECEWLTAIFGHRPAGRFTVHLRPFNQFLDGSGGAFHSANYMVLDTSISNPRVSIGLFVAEAAEQFALGCGWNPGWSNGEALSRFLGMLRYEELQLHYRAGFHWLDSDRADWINATDPTDRNPISFGCGTLFLFWMFIQLKADLFALARSGGPNLASTAARACPGATFAGFRALTDVVWPVGTTTTGRLDTDCPFPIEL